MPVPIICLITSGEGNPTDLVGEAASEGVDWVQIREPHIAGGRLTTLVGSAIEAAAGSPCRIIVNDRVDVAIATGAAGVHLRGDSVPAARVRRIVPSAFLIGRSVHQPEEAVTVTHDGGCDYLIFGTVFETRSKPSGHPVAGLDRLRDVCRSTTLPVIAVGGITVENAAAAIAAGASGIAAIGLFRSAGAIATIVARLRRQFDS